MNLKEITLCLLALFGAQCLCAQNKKVEVKGFVQEEAAPNSYVWPADEAVRAKLEQWRDLKFGVLFHWGMYSPEGIVESWSVVSRDIDWQYANRLKKGMDYETYKKWYFALNEKFNPVNFDPNQWAEVMADAGMKYMLFTAKHHDGFCMYDSKYTDYSIARGPFKDNPRRDVLRHVFEAFRDKGFMVGPYFSKPDFHCEWFWNPLFSTGGTELRPNYKPERHPDWWRKYKEFTCNQVAEITQDYGRVDIVWMDGGSRAEELGIDSVLRVSRLKYPGMLSVDRGQPGPWENYRTPENNIPDTQLDYPWESCITLSPFWTYHYNDRYKSPRKVVNMLVEIVAKGGCMALGVGPTPDGLIEQPVVDVLHVVGDWLRRYGKAIYGTRATKVYHDGHTWFTADKNGKTLYAVYALPEKEALPATIRWKGNVPVGRMRLVDSGKAVRYKVEGDEVVVTLPRGMAGDSFALQFDVR